MIEDGVLNKYPITHWSLTHFETNDALFHIIYMQNNQKFVNLLNLLERHDPWPLRFEQLVNESNQSTHLDF